MNELTGPIKSELVDAAFDGIMLGRTLHDIEKALGVKAEDLLSLIRRDDKVASRWREAREWSAYVIENEVSRKLADNADSPESATKNAALKEWANHMRWVAERLNPAIYSGKLPVNITTPIQIITTLDFGGPKMDGNVYALEATVSEVIDKGGLESEVKAIEAPGAMVEQKIKGNKSGKKAKKKDIPNE